MVKVYYEDLSPFRLSEKECEGRASRRCVGTGGARWS